MKKSTFIYLSMIFLFAFTQVGVAMHSINHWVDCHEEQHQDQGEAEEACVQCLSISHADGVHLSRDYHLTFTAGRHIFVEDFLAALFAPHHFVYAVRAPPQLSQV